MLQDSQSYKEKPCLKKINTPTNQTNKNEERKTSVLLKSTVAHHFEQLKELSIKPISLWRLPPPSYSLGPTNVDTHNPWPGLVVNVVNTRLPFSPERYSLTVPHHLHCISGQERIGMLSQSSRVWGTHSTCVSTLLLPHPPFLGEEQVSSACCAGHLPSLAGVCCSCLLHRHNVRMSSRATTHWIVKPLEYRWTQLGSQ